MRKKEPKFSGLALVVGSRKKRRRLRIGAGQVVGRGGDKYIVQFNGTLRPARPGELHEPYHKART